MATGTAVATGKFVWYELMTDDPKRATGFYSTIFGWKLENMEGMEMPYTVVSSKKSQIGGIMGRPKGLPKDVPPHWMPYVLVSKLETAAEQVKSLGGKIVMGPKDVQDMGRFSIMMDPQGAHLALWEQINGASMPPDTQPGIGDVAWNELLTTDYKAALKFYSALFGWKADKAHDMGADVGMYQTFASEGTPIGGMFNITPDMQAPPNWGIYISVPDINKTVDAVKTNGGKLIHGPMEVPGGSMIATFEDPTGAMFSAIQVKNM